MAAKRLRAFVRVREAVAASAEPQLQRGQDWRIIPPAKAKKKKRKKSGRKAKPARESTRFRVELRETDVRKSGGAFEATVLREGPGNPEDKNAYSREALRGAVGSGRFEGLQAFADHPTASEERDRPERSVRQLVGHFREAHYVEEGGLGKVKARFVPISGPGYEWVTSLIESALKAPAGKPLIGISIDGYGHAPDTKEINGRTYNLVREITHLGSADIVTRAGAGGMFHRKLSESLAGARASVGDAPVLSARKLQERVRDALSRLESGLAAEDEQRVRGAFVALSEAATATVKRPSSQGAKAEVKALETKVRKAEKRATEAESMLARSTLAGALLREVDVPPDTRRAWFDDLLEQPDEPSMRQLLERRQTERRNQIAELREAAGLNYGVEGNPRREPASISSAPPGGDLLARLGIDPDELDF